MEVSFVFRQDTTDTQAQNIIDMSKYNSNNNAYTAKKISDDKAASVLAELKKSKMRWWNAFNINLQSFRTDKYFYMGSLQWDATAYQQYTQLGKIPYTFNLLKPIVRQLQGEMASMQPSITLSSKNHQNVNPQMLILMTDFLRAEMYHHKASEAYNECFFNQCVGGWGVLELETDYEDPYTFAQVIKVKSSVDPLMVGFDPTAELKTKCDGAFQFKDFYMTKDEFRATFNREPPAAGQMVGTPQEFMPVIDSDLVIVTDYYRKEYKSKTLVQLSNHDNYMIEVLEKDIEIAHQEYQQMMLQSGMELDQIQPLVITNKRKTKIETIHCYQCIWNDVLNHKIWPSKYLPFVFVDANSSTQDGKQYTESYIRSAKDAQMSYNYCLSEIYNGIPKSRRETVYLTRTQAKGHEEYLRYPDRQQSHCEYNFDPMVPGGPIFRAAVELPETLFNAAALAKQAVYDGLGIQPVNGSELPSNLGAATVGRIITQGNLTFAKLLNNLFDAMQQIGNTFLDLVPKIFDMERIINTVDATGAVKTATINTVENGAPKNILSDIIYHLEVKPMASFAIQQQELRQNLFQLAQLDIQNPPLVSDLIASTLETPIAPLLTKRLQSLVPANVIAEEHGMPAPPPTPPSPQAQLLQMQIQKLNSAKNLDDAKVQAVLEKNQLGSQQVAQKAQEAAVKAQIEQQKLMMQQNESSSNAQQSYIKSAAELQKAKLDRDAKIIPALAKFHQVAATKSTKNIVE